ncbi:hypothetical protein AJ79_02665 [Helicocarpus griseus UAMH5409]|uniref:Amidase domain-containing protein n=1 Tax=Helicocarpus griseus UAMH5409 TaxID=1447875 RepID=A0A2B7Y1B6_9EURO|nr:hypothetical protein AJ79_02665 [Helicocarpus griseus UAMH5409]
MEGPELSTSTGKQSWEIKAANKRASILANIPREWRLEPLDLEKAANQREITGSFIQQFLNEEEVTIIQKDSVSLVADIKDQNYTALQVTRAFCKVAAIAHQINNCLHEIFFDQALKRASELDDYVNEHKSTMGPLHGLPISLKDQFHVRGTDTSMGYVGWISTYEGRNDPHLTHKVDSQIVTELLSLGAVLYCKTSLPQTLLFGETENNIIGRTLNPVNQNLSCGGSSGGEAALKALRGSTLGVGTDIGGSVRIPAAFCGVFSIKPTHNRFSYRDVANVIPGQTTYASSVGFLGTTIDALQLIMSSVLSTQPWLRDPNVAPIPWRYDMSRNTLLRATDDGKAKSGSCLKLGIFWTDGVVTLQPPISRGLRLAVDALTKAGHKIVNWLPPPQKDAKRIHLSFLRADGHHDVHKQLNLSGEPLIPPLRETFGLEEPMSLLEYQRLTLEGRDYEAAYSDYWNSLTEEDGQAVDAVIMPVAPHAAVIPGKYYHTAYTEAINLLDYSVAVIPVTKADKNIDLPDKDFVPVSEVDAKNWAAYDPEIYHGAPVGIQIVARKYEEEKVWAIGKIVHTILEDYLKHA